jgi:hypothetical protein
MAGRSEKKAAAKKKPKALMGKERAPSSPPAR